MDETKNVKRVAFSSVLIPLIAIILFLSGCATNVVFVKEGEVLRIKDGVAHVYVMRGGDWVECANKVPLPPGWYVVPPIKE